MTTQIEDIADIEEIEEIEMKDEIWNEKTD
jgi:hypothetical protein